VCIYKNLLLQIQKTILVYKECNLRFTCCALPLNCLMNNEMKGDAKIEIQLDPDILKGIYANVTNIGHTQEEFLIDFLLVQQQPAPFGKLVSRIIVTPGHARRLLSALQDNIRKYEENFGKLEVTPAPKNQIIQ